MKTFVLDTNILLTDPEALFAFEENDILIPLAVVEELDKFKKDESILGRNARQAARYLDELRGIGNLSGGVKTKAGGILYVLLDTDIPDQTLSADKRIIQAALHSKRLGSYVVLVTKDINLRIQADAYGIKAEDYKNDKTKEEVQYNGYSIINVEKRIINSLYTNEYVEFYSDFSLDRYVVLKTIEDSSSSALARYCSKTSRLQLLKPVKNVFGISPKNVEQIFALDLLLNDDVKLVTITGKAGTGKTLLALAAGLHKTMEERIYTKYIVSRPIFPLGKDIGYLPGTVEEKLDPWMKPIIDNVSFLLSLAKSGTRNTGYKELKELDILEVEPLTYIRGRSIPNQFMLVDEAQNLTKHEMKTIITRVGEGTKIILTGDTQQIDNPYLDASSCGLSHVINCFKNQPIAGHITMQTGERSELSEIASKIV